MCSGCALARIRRASVRYFAFAQYALARARPPLAYELWRVYVLGLRPCAHTPRSRLSPIAMSWRCRALCILPIAGYLWYVERRFEL